MSWRRLHEVGEFHPIMREYLLAKGWQVNAEIWVEERKRADFVAQSQEGRVYAIECKSILTHQGQSADLTDSLKQAKSYGSAIFAPAILAIPDYDFTEVAKRDMEQQAKDQGVDLWIIPLPDFIREQFYDAPEPPTQLSLNLRFPLKNEDGLSLADLRAISPEEFNRRFPGMVDRFAAALRQLVKDGALK